MPFQGITIQSFCTFNNAIQFHAELPAEIFWKPSDTLLLTQCGHRKPGSGDLFIHRPPGHNQLKRPTLGFPSVCDSDQAGFYHITRTMILLSTKWNPQSLVRSVAAVIQQHGFGNVQTFHTSLLERDHCSASKATDSLVHRSFFLSAFVTTACAVQNAACLARFRQLSSLQTEVISVSSSDANGCSISKEQRSPQITLCVHTRTESPLRQSTSFERYRQQTIEILIKHGACTNASLSSQH